MSFGRAAEVLPGGKVGLGGEKCPVLFGGIPGNAYLCTAKRKKGVASLAQLVEQLTLNQWVQGSSP